MRPTGLGWGTQATQAHATDIAVLSALRGSLAKSSVQKAAALHLLPLSQSRETLLPALLPARSPPWPPGPPVSPGHKATSSQHLLTGFFAAHFGGVLWVGKSWKPSFWLCGQGGGTLRSNRWSGTPASEAGAGALGGLAAAAPGGRVGTGRWAQGLGEDASVEGPSWFGFNKDFNFGAYLQLYKMHGIC